MTKHAAELADTEVLAEVAALEELVAHVTEEIEAQEEDPDDQVLDEIECELDAGLARARALSL